MTKKLRLTREVAGPWGCGKAGDVVDVPVHLADGLEQLKHAQHPDLPLELDPAEEPEKQ